MQQYSPEELNEILNIYKSESEEIIQEMNDDFLVLEKNPENKEPLKKLFQLAHSLKGASRMLGFTSVQDIAHKLEDILSFWKKDEISINVDSFQIIYQVCDYLNSLVEKSVENKQDYRDSNVVVFINKLDNFITYNKMIPVKNPNKLPENYISQKSTDINAAILELMFLLENTDEDKNELFLLISDNVSQLNDIFIKTDFEKVKEKISEITSYLKESGASELVLEEIKNKVIDLRQKIYDVYKQFNVSINLHKNFQQKKQNQTINKPINETKTDSSVYDNEYSKIFEYIFANIQKIKYEKEYLKSISDILEQISDKIKETDIKFITSKIINILKKAYDRNLSVDNDCYTVLLRSISLIQRVLEFNQEENKSNIDFIMQRLSVVDDMFEIKKMPLQTDTDLKDVDSPEVYSQINSNISNFEFQEIKTLRVDTAKLDNLISQTGELLINSIKTQEHTLELSKINSKLIKWSSTSKKIINYLKYIEKKGFFSYETDDANAMFFKRIQEFFNNNSEIINDINMDFSNLYNVISEDDNKFHQTVIEIENIAKGIRVLPLATLFHSFPRMIRDIANENNKKVEFIVSGSDTAVDKKIIEEIKMPLVHILRNSVSHGIETPDIRIKNNKNETGTVKLTSKQVENNVIITIEDDGYGVNIEKVKEIAKKKGLLTDEELTNSSNEQIMKLLFLPGFSTEDSVTEISGRGIGLDIVKTKINNLNGDILIESVLNKGCRVTIKVPLSMSSIKAFILLVNNQKYAIPINAIKQVKIIKGSEILYKNGIYCIVNDGRSIPIYYLSEIFGESKKGCDLKQLTVIVIENQKQQKAFIVDKLLGDTEVFQKKLIAPIVKIKNISGFTTLSTGEICLIINPFELIRNTD